MKAYYAEVKYEDYIGLTALEVRQSAKSYLVEGERAIVGGGCFLKRIPKDEETKTEYHSYVNGKDCCMDSESLDQALAVCIAYKHEGGNHGAAYYFMKMLKGE